MKNKKFVIKNQMKGKNAMAKTTYKNMNEKNNPMGKILLISYNDAEFAKICDEWKGAGIVDTRKTGWSQNSAVSAEALSAKYEGRYFQKPAFTPEKGMDVEEYYKATMKDIAIMRKCAIAGYSLIVTSWSPSLLKIIGALLLDGDRQIPVILKWENSENKQSGLSPQRRMPREELYERIEKWLNPMAGFTAKETFDFNLNG